MMSQQWDPKVTIDVMVRTILSLNPPSRINVGMDSKFGLLLYSMYPAWVRNFFNQLLLPDQTPAVLATIGSSTTSQPELTSSSSSKKDE
jgi:hypothetical protein